MGRTARNGNRAAIESQSTVGGRLSATRLLLLLVASLSTAAPASAQTGTGDIHGVVTEQTAGPAGGVAVVAANRSTGLERRSTTDDAGRFVLPGLPPGAYDITATMDGFAAVRQEDVAVGAGRTVVSRLELRRAAQNDTIVLAPNPPSLEPLRSGTATTISVSEVAHLPLDARDPLDLARLAPAFSRGPGGTGTAGLPASYVFFTLDGVRTDWLGNAASPAGVDPRVLSRDAIGDLQIGITTPLHVGAGAGTVDVVTRSGSRVFSATLFELFRDDALDGNSPANVAAGRPRAQARGNQFGGSAGGPLTAGPHMFFVSFDGVRDRDENSVFVNRPLLPPTAAGAAGLARLDAEGQSWPRTRREGVFLLRTDHVLAPGRQLTLRYHQTDADDNAAAAAGPRQALETSGDGERQSRMFVASTGFAVGALFNHVRGAYSSDRQEVTANSATPAADVRDAGSSLLRVGGSPLGPYSARRRRLQLADTLVWTRESHTVKAGFDVDWDRLRVDVAPLAHGAYLFQSLDTFATGSPAGPGDTFSQTFLRDGASSVRVAPGSIRSSFHIADRWLVGDAVTVDAALRYERASIAQPSYRQPDPQLAAAGYDTSRIPDGGHGWGPHVGIAWSASRRAVVRAAYDIAYSPSSVGAQTAAWLYNGRDLRTVTLRGARGDTVPTYPARLDTLPSGAIGPIVAFSDSFETGRLARASAGLDWEWMPNTIVSVNYLHVRGSRLARAVDANVGSVTTTSLTVAGEGMPLSAVGFLPGPYSGVGRLIRLESTGSSRYDGLSVEMRRRLSQGLEYRLAYTIAEATDTVPFDGTFTAYTLDDRLVTEASSDSLVETPAAGDQRHRLVATVVLFTKNFAERRGRLLRPVLDGWRIGAIYTLESGRPFSAYASDDLNGDGNGFNDLAPGTARHQFDRGKQGRLDSRFARPFQLPRGIRLVASLDVFNVLNASHPRQVEDVLYVVNGTTLARNPRFGERFDDAAPRTIQLGIGLEF